MSSAQAFFTAYNNADYCVSFRITPYTADDYNNKLVMHHDGNINQIRNYTLYIVFVSIFIKLIEILRPNLTEYIHWLYNIMYKTKSQHASGMCHGDDH